MHYNSPSRWKFEPDIGGCFRAAASPKRSVENRVGELGCRSKLSLPKKLALGSY